MNISLWIIKNIQMQNIGGKSQECLNYCTDILKWKMLRIYKLFLAYSVPEKWSEYFPTLFWPRIGYIFWGAKISGVLIFPGCLPCWQDTHVHDMVHVTWTMWHTRCEWCDVMHDATLHALHVCTSRLHHVHHIVHVTCIMLFITLCTCASCWWGRHSGKTSTPEILVPQKM